MITARNLTAGAEVSGTADSTGGLSLSLPAGIADAAEVTVTEPSGKTVTFSAPFRNPGGTTVIGAEGGTVTGPGGIRAAVPAGAVPDGTFIRLDSFSETDLNRPVPDIITFLGGIEIITDAVAEKEMKLSVPLSSDSDLTPESQILVFEEIEVFGEPQFSLNNIARAKNGRIETASPPFPGARARGRFWMGAPEVPMEFFMANISMRFFMGSASPAYFFLSAPFTMQLELAAYANEATVSPIFVVPKDQAFILSMYSSDGDEIATRDYGTLNTAGGIRNLVFPAPGDEGPVGILSSYPPDKAENAGIGTEITVVFDRQVSPGRFELLDDRNMPVSTETEEFESEGTVRGFIFKPVRRLKYNTEYTVRLEGVSNLFDAGRVLSPEVWHFRTSDPKTLGSFSVDNPSHISVLDGTRVAVADGKTGAEDRNRHGVVLADVSDPKAPKKLAEYVIAGNTLGVRAAGKISLPDFGLSGPAVIAVSGGLDSFSEVAVLKVGNSTLERIGSVLLGADAASLNNGFVPMGVPPYSGIPVRAALYQNDNVYVAAMGIGIQAVRISDGIRRLTEGQENIVRGTFTFGSDCPAPVTVETAGDVVLAGDIRSLRWLEPGLTEIFHMNIPARDIHAVPDFPVTPDEHRDLAFVLGQNRILYIVDVADKNILSGIRFGKAFGSDFPKSVRVSPYDRLAYIGTFRDVYIADVSKPAEEIADWDADVYFDEDRDGKDDRILGKVSGLPGAGSVDINRRTGYVADSGGSRVHTFLIHEPVTIISPAEVFRDRIFDFTVSVYPPEETSGKTFSIELSQGELTENLKTRENVQMYDFGYTDNEGTVMTGVTGYTFQPEDNGSKCFKAVVNKAPQKVRIRVTEVTDSEDEPLTGETGEINVLSYIRQYATPQQHDYNQYDDEFIEAAEDWGNFYQHAVDPDLLKAMGMTESNLGLLSDDIMQIGNPGDHTLDKLHYEPGHQEREVDIPNNSTRPLNYPRAVADIYWGTCWLYHKAQIISENSSPEPPYVPDGWCDWDTAVERFNGGGTMGYLDRVHRAYLGGVHPTTEDIYLWPILTNKEARRD